MNLINLANNISNNDTYIKELLIRNLSRRLDYVCTNEDVLERTLKKHNNGGPSENLITLNKSLLNEIKNNENKPLKDDGKYIVVEKTYDVECLTDKLTFLDYYMYPFIYDSKTGLQKDISELTWKEILNYPIWEKSIKEYGEVEVYDTIVEEIKYFGFSEIMYNKNRKEFLDMINNIPSNVDDYLKKENNDTVDWSLFEKEINISKEKQVEEDTKIGLKEES